MGFDCIAQHGGNAVEREPTTTKTQHVRHLLSCLLMVRLMVRRPSLLDPVDTMVASRSCFMTSLREQQANFKVLLQTALQTVSSKGAVGTSADYTSAKSFFRLFKRDLVHAVHNVPRPTPASPNNDDIVRLHNLMRRAYWRWVPHTKLVGANAFETEIELDLFLDFVEERAR
ncbi:MAG: hypothetical protein OXG08_06430 [Gammaproteobacteria bacterium]|nr:hypothetical protein [Gammaproteobacteria bacterium]